VGDFIIDRFESADELAGAAAGQWLDELAAFSGENYHAAVSGGRISGNFFTAVAASEKRRVFWLRPVHFFWADERCVPPDDEESNYRLASEKLLQPANIPKEHVHRIPGEEPPAKAAEFASAEMRGVVPVNAAGWPVLDMIFLGMGEDGHVASLFPRANTSPAPNIYFPVVAGKPPPNRITLCYEAIAAAKEVWVLVSGSGKEAALRDSLSPTGRTPLAQVIRLRQQTRLLTNLE